MKGTQRLYSPEIHVLNFFLHDYVTHTHVIFGTFKELRRQQLCTLLGDVVLVSSDPRPGAIVVKRAGNHNIDNDLAKCVTRGKTQASNATDVL